MSDRALSSSMREGSRWAFESSTARKWIRWIPINYAYIVEGSVELAELNLATPTQARFSMQTPCNSFGGLGISLRRLTNLEFARLLFECPAFVQTLLHCVSVLILADFVQSHLLAKLLES
ncbi:hypothetical protein WR25_24862 [Diploscapter pachys]|uniref:Uncharacterized protein n=1 Tax=Diploscapter pachys TaxID=2018661 RepID=A0A2A2L4J9_9BILA|nr:hypothetical protein WR25_24862 [Diploscapter pachys]